MGCWLDLGVGAAETSEEKLPLQWTFQGVSGPPSDPDLLVGSQSAALE